MPVSGETACVVYSDHANTKAYRYNHIWKCEVGALDFNTQTLTHVAYAEHTQCTKCVKGSDSRRDDMLNYPGDV